MIRTENLDMKKTNFLSESFKSMYRVVSFEFCHELFVMEMRFKIYSFEPAWYYIQGFPVGIRQDVFVLGSHDYKIPVIYGLNLRGEEVIIDMVCNLDFLSRRKVLQDKYRDLLANITQERSLVFPYVTYGTTSIVYGTFEDVDYSSDFLFKGSVYYVCDFSNVKKNFYKNVLVWLDYYGSFCEDSKKRRFALVDVPCSSKVTISAQMFPIVLRSVRTINFSKDYVPISDGFLCLNRSLMFPLPTVREFFLMYSFYDTEAIKLMNQTLVDIEVEDKVLENQEDDMREIVPDGVYVDWYDEKSVQNGDCEYYKDSSGMVYTIDYDENLEF